MEIPRQASICHSCGGSQKSWKNKLRSIASIVGFLVVVSSLLTYLAATVPQLKKIIFGEPAVDIIAFNTNKSVVISNSGDFDVFVSHISLKSKLTGDSVVFHIQKAIKEGEYLTHEFLRKQKDEDYWITFPMEQKLWNMISSSVNPETDCFQWSYFSSEDPHFINMKGFLKEKLRTIKTITQIHYYSNGKNRIINEPVVVYGVPYKNTKSSCSEWYVQKSQFSSD